MQSVTYMALIFADQGSSHSRNFHHFSLQYILCILKLLNLVVNFDGL
jgi:hypothetical protein